MRELELRGIATVNQRLVRIEYRGLVFDEPLRSDVLVEDCLLLELKCVQAVLPIHKAQLLSYMKLLDIPLGLIISFPELKLVDGVVRMILPGANRESGSLNRRKRGNEGHRGVLYGNPLEMCHAPGEPGRENHAVTSSRTPVRRYGQRL
jgi:GxxExxY protein